VTLAWEHSEEGHPYIGWSVNGETVMDPGGDPLVLEPCPGLASVRYTCPIDDLYHQISFTSTPGHPQVCFWVQALSYATANLDMTHRMKARGRAYALMGLTLNGRRT